jgi:7-carboxy-7-deazaguanine synthase
MKISEVFATIQGEGLLTGVPSLFIRTSGCNLRCHWCDTPYTSWQPEGEDWSSTAGSRHGRGAPRLPPRRLTGGEPMIQPELPALTRALHGRGLHITIETAGTVDADVVCDLMSIPQTWPTPRPGSATRAGLSATSGSESTLPCSSASRAITNTN